MSYRNRTRVTRVALINACLVGAVAFSGVAGAQEVVIDSVSVTLVGRDETMGELARLLAEWNANLSVRRVQHIDAADILGSNGTGMLRIWVLMVPGWGAKIYLSDPLWQWQTALEAQYELPMRIVTSEATLQLRTWSVEVNVACDRTQPSHFVLGIESGVSVTYTTYGLSSVSRSSINALPDAAHYRPMGYVGARSGYDWGALRLRVRLGAEVALQKTHHDITERPLFTPWLLTPRLAVELAWR